MYIRRRVGHDRVELIEKFLFRSNYGADVVSALEELQDDMLSRLACAAHHEDALFPSLAGRTIRRVVRDVEV